MVDDFHGTRQWDGFMASMSRVFPDRPVEEIDSSDPVFHIVYNLDDRYQVPGAQFLRSGRTYEGDGYEPTGAASAMTAGADGGDLFQHGSGRQLGVGGRARVPRKVLSAGDRIALNNVVYSMTH